MEINGAVGWHAFASAGAGGIRWDDWGIQRTELTLPNGVDIANPPVKGKWTSVALRCRPRAYSVWMSTQIHWAIRQKPPPTSYGHPIPLSSLVLKFFPFERGFFTSCRVLFTAVT
jgi:hypothetical protein